MLQKTWKVKQKAPDSFLKKFKQYPPLLLQLLYCRGIKTKKDIESFLSIDYEKDLLDPYLLSGMKKAVKRIKKAVQADEKIAIFGDYDADGLCASTILYDTFQKIGVKPAVYLPDRKKGYGLNQDVIRQMAKEKISLLITVDCGSSDVDEIALAKKSGIDVIVTDHHLMPLVYPPAYIIINPRKKSDKYPNKNLSGAGVAFKLASALIQEYQNKFKQGAEKWLLDLVAIATVADMMKLTGENRTLVKYGLLVLAKTRRIGLRILMEEAGIKEIKIKWINRKKNRFLIENISAYTIGFVIGPRLNAAGRMAHANKAFLLLNAPSIKEARRLAKELSLKNQARQRLQAKIAKQIEQSLTQDDLSNKVIFRGDSSYPIGIVGLIAGKLTDKLYLPTFIYHKGKKSSRGSCRGIPEINVVSILQQCSSALEEFGGHKAAGGFSLSNKNIKKFKKLLVSTTKKALKGKKLSPRLFIDAELSCQDINYGLKKTLEELAPFGEGNREPIFILRNALVWQIRHIGKKSQHLSLKLHKIASNGKDYYFKALLFENAVPLEGISKDKHYDFVFAPLFDTWQGRRQITLKIIDWRLSRKKRNL